MRVSVSTWPKKLNNLMFGKFQRIMMCSRVVLVDLPKDGRRVFDHLPSRMCHDVRSTLSEWRRRVFVRKRRDIRRQNDCVANRPS